MGQKDPDLAPVYSSAYKANIESKKKKKKVFNLKP